MTIDTQIIINGFDISSVLTDSSNPLITVEDFTIAEFVKSNLNKFNPPLQGDLNDENLDRIGVKIHKIETCYTNMYECYISQNSKIISDTITLIID